VRLGADDVFEGGTELDGELSVSDKHKSNHQADFRCRSRELVAALLKGAHLDQLIPQRKRDVSEIGFAIVPMT
jgi:hypothetical protein